MAFSADQQAIFFISFLNFFLCLKYFSLYLVDTKWKALHLIFKGLAALEKLADKGGWPFQLATLKKLKAANGEINYIKNFYINQDGHGLSLSIDSVQLFWSKILLISPIIFNNPIQTYTNYLYTPMSKNQKKKKSIIRERSIRFRSPYLYIRVEYFELPWVTQLQLNIGYSTNAALINLNAA